MFAALCNVSEGMFVVSVLLVTLLTASTKKRTVLVLSRISTAKSRRSSLSGAVSSFLVSSLKSTSATWSCIPARWTTSTLNSEKQSRHRASGLELSDRFKIHSRDRYKL